MDYEKLSDMIASLMCDYGPDGHCDGHELIAREIFDRVKEWKDPEHEHDWKDDWDADGFYRCVKCGKSPTKKEKEKIKPGNYNKDDLVHAVMVANVMTDVMGKDVKNG